METVKKNYRIFLLGILIIGIFVYYNAYILGLGDSYLNEEVHVKNLVLDMMCDIAESDDPVEMLLETVGEIDTLKQRGVYCAAYDAKFNVISERSPLFGPYDPLKDDRDLKRDVERQNRGKSDILRKADGETPEHTMHIYWRWVYQDTSEPMLIILGMSKFSVETNHETGLMVGFWILCGVFATLGVTSIIPLLKRRKRGSEDD